MIKRPYNELLNRLETIAESPQVLLQSLGEFETAGRTYNMVVLELGKPGPGKRSVMLGGGIHGDEPAGVEAAVRFLEENAANDALLTQFHFVVFPCGNPSGYESDTRENANGVDLNREFAMRNPSVEVELIMKGLAGRCFDLIFEMHEDIDAPGFYLYEIAGDPRNYIAEQIIAAVESMGCPINTHRVIEHTRAENGIIRRDSIRFRKTGVPWAIYAYRTCGGHVITLEPPASMLPLDDRVSIELTALRIALQSLIK